MRHRYKFRQLNRSPKHRKSLIKTMCSQLIEHERIFTTLAKAKELHRHMERLIHKAKRLTREDHLYLRQNLTTTIAIKKLKEEIGPRFRKLPAGFTRVESMGTRANDKAQVGMIEIMGNHFQEEKRQNIDALVKEFDLDTFWQWESKISEQEVDYYEALLRDLKSEIDAEVAERLDIESMADLDSIPKKMRTAD